MRIARLSFALLIAALALLPATAQTPGPESQEQKPPALDDISISPSRFELQMLPGTEKTVVVNLIYKGVAVNASATRLVAYLGDWSMSIQGKLEFQKAGTQERSACPWMIYSPAEMVATPGQANSIRVTISVPRDATPGDHLAVLLVEPRPDDLKLDRERRQVRMKFRLASIFYIMIPAITQRGSLENLRAEASDQGIIVTPRIRNEGNSHIRPLYSIKLVNQTGAAVAELPETESLPVLANSEVEVPIVINKSLPAGVYEVRYRVRLTEGGPITEGRTEMRVGERTEQKVASQNSGKRSDR